MGIVPVFIIMACIIAMPINGGEARKLALWVVIGLAIFTLAREGN